MTEELTNVLAYMQKGMGLLFGICEKIKPKRSAWVSEDDPRADYVVPFEVAGKGQLFEFVRLWHFIGQSSLSTMFVIKKSIAHLKVGGFLLIVENAEHTAGEKCFYNYMEMEGLLMLFEDFIHIDARGVNADGKTYFYVARKQANAAIKIQEAVNVAE